MKITMRQHLTSVRRATVNKSKNASRQDVEKTEPPRECKRARPAPVESSVEMPRGMENGYGPATPLPGVDPKTSETPIWKNISISTFIAALFTVAKIWKPPKRPSVDEWI